MAWPYEFVTLDEQEKDARSILLFRYGVYAQLSAVVPILMYQLSRLASWVHEERRRARLGHQHPPTSPQLKQHRTTWSGALAVRWRTWSWWLDDETAPGWPSRRHLLGAVCWTIWLLFLCVHQTGRDYFHVTKRFGIVAISQFPMHYLLSLKSRFSPMGLILRTSHENLNAYHRLLGRIIHILVLLHGIFYLNFFYQAGIVSQRLTEVVPLLGLAAASLMTLLAFTSFAAVRRWSYRLFFIVHLVAAIAMIPLLWFHHPRTRIYAVEALAVFFIDIAVRKLGTVHAPASIKPIPSTSLLEVKVPIPPSKMVRYAAPGQHVYVSIPPENSLAKGSQGLIYRLMFNPFTVADVSKTDITLVLRVGHGPMTLGLQDMSATAQAGWPIHIDGPYGTARQFPDLPQAYDRILLVAGGVGATFILPIFRQVRLGLERAGLDTSRVELVWSTRASAETSWAEFPGEAKALHPKDGVQIYVTGVDGDIVGPASRYGAEEEDVELDEIREEASLIPTSRRRPDFAEIIDRVFAHGAEERVAVLVCGPDGMARDVRQHVGKWIANGRDVWWHDETFGW